jgi:hypothetical protein
MVLVIDCSDLEWSAAFWCAYSATGATTPAGQYLVLFPAKRTGIQLLLQRVDDSKLAKNRLHLDLRTRELGPEVERIRTAGGLVATEEPMAELGFTWQIRTATSCAWWSHRQSTGESESPTSPPAGLPDHAQMIRSCAASPITPTCSDRCQNGGYRVGLPVRVGHTL